MPNTTKEDRRRALTRRRQRRRRERLREQAGGGDVLRVSRKRGRVSSCSSDELLAVVPGKPPEMALFFPTLADDSEDNFASSEAEDVGLETRSAGNVHMQDKCDVPSTSSADSDREQNKVRLSKRYLEGSC